MRSTGTDTAPSATAVFLASLSLCAAEACCSSCTSDAISACLSGTAEAEDGAWFSFPSPWAWACAWAWAWAWACALDLYPGMEWGEARCTRENMGRPPVPAPVPLPPSLLLLLLLLLL